MANDRINQLWQELQDADTQPRAAKADAVLRKSMSDTTYTQPTSDGTECVVGTSSTACNFHLEVNRMAHDRPNVRKKAAVALERHILVETSDQHFDFDVVAKLLFKRFHDSIEKVRDVSIRLCILSFQNEQDIMRYLPYLMPSIVSRIESPYAFDGNMQEFTRDAYLQEAFQRGRIYVDEKQVDRRKPTEPSEEIRLLFLQLIETILQNVFTHSASSILHAYIFDMILVLVNGLHDPYHEVNIRSCHLLALISDHMVSVMKHFSVAIVRAMKHLLLHRVARVRVAAINGIRTVLSCPNVEKCKGSGTETLVELIGHREENVIPIAAFYVGETRVNYFARLDQDANSSVRKAFYAMVGDWITTLPDRYDHESRLLPYLLSGVSDEILYIAIQAMKTLEMLGNTYEQEHASEVIEMKQYGIDGRNPSYNYNGQLPAPFHERPSLGTRLFVRGRARRFLQPVLRELTNWQSQTRVRAARLLKTILVYCEETLTVDAHIIVASLRRVWGDKELQKDIEEAAELVGRFTSPDTYLKILLPRIRGEDDAVATITPTATCSTLQLMMHLMRGSLDRVLLPHVKGLVDAVASPHVQRFSDMTVQAEASAMLLQVAQIMQRRGVEVVAAYYRENGRLPAMDKLYETMFRLAVIYAESSLDTTSTNGEMVLEVLADLLPDVGSTQELLDKQGKLWLSDLYDIADQNTQSSHLPTETALIYILQRISDEVLLESKVMDGLKVFLETTQQEKPEDNQHVNGHFQERLLETLLGRIHAMNDKNPVDNDALGVLTELRQYAGEVGAE